MDFSKLLAKASSNAASSRSKVEEAMKEIDAQKQKRTVQLRGQHKRPLTVPVVAKVVPQNGNKQSKAAPAKKPVVTGSGVAPANASGKAKPAAPADTYTVSARRSFYHLMQKAENNVSTLSPTRPKSKISNTIDSSATQRIDGCYKGPSVNGLNGFRQHQSSIGPGRKEAPPPLGISANLDLTSTSSRRRKKVDLVKHPRQQPPPPHGTGNKNSSLPSTQERNDEVITGVMFETTKERRYLPGDLRYKPPTGVTNEGASRQAPVLPRCQSKSGQQAPPAAKRSQKREPQQGGGPPLKRRQLTETPPPKPHLSSKTGSERGGRLTAAAEIERRQLEKELEELDRLKAERMAKLKRMRETANCRTNGQQIPPPPPSRRQPLPISSSSTRPKPQWTHNHHHSSHPYPARSIRIENEEYDEDDDEYDSDLADFIDDTDLGTDEVGRSEMEAALKLLNPKYDTKKWKEREREINISRMQSSHRDIEKEEAVSRRLGLYEDLREAQRGSQRIKE